jgi:hypothetical protein
MPATGRRELDEGYEPLAFEELAAIYRTLKLVELTVLIYGHTLVVNNVVKQDIDRVRAALTRINFITPEETE